MTALEESGVRRARAGFAGLLEGFGLAAVSSDYGSLPLRVSGDAAWTNRGLLIYGPRKAGTTLFQGLLDGGDELLAYPVELKLKYFSRKIFSTKTASKYREHSRISEVTSNHFDAAAYNSLWARAGKVGRRWPVSDLIRFDVWSLMKALDRAPARLTQWCAKEVGGRHQDVVAYWRRLFPGAKAVFIVRDPYAVASAILRSRQRKAVHLSEQDIATEVFDTLRTLRRQSAYLGDPTVHFTVYEDLIADPEAEMRKVARFLGLAWSEVYSRPTLFGEPVVVRTASRQTTDVFRSQADWREGLSQFEQRAVTRAIDRADAIPGTAVDYGGLRAAIAARFTSVSI